MRRRIGSGGFATVWLAYDEELDSPVAVKVLADNWSEDLHVRQRFVEEGRFLRKVESPHVVPVYDAGQLEDGRPYLVMAYADQGNLADRLELSRLPLGQGVAVIRQVGSGLHALHQRGVLHRDVKPANVLFRTVDGEVRAMVGDLGLGKALDMSSRLTMIAGTPSYVSPEQARGEGLDPRADLYSLGALAYLLLAGHPPYSHASLAAAANPEPPAPLPPGLPPAVDGVLRRALAPNRADRWASVPHFVEALSTALEGHPDALTAGPQAWIPVDPDLTVPGARPSPLVRPSRASSSEQPAATRVTRPRRGRRVLAAVLGLAALAGGAAGGWALQQRQPTEVELSDESGSLSVTVPGAWAVSSATAAWTPPGQADDYPALATGGGPRWQERTSTKPGVFLGVLPGTEIPERLPRHPECDRLQGSVEGTSDGRPSTTVTWADCPGGVTVERVVQVAANRLLWVQVRSADQATANRVLDSVAVHGM